MSFLQIQGLEKTYPDGTQAVRGIDLSVERGEFVVLLGPSGCGKTTTLRMIAGLEIPTGGRITLDGDEVTTLRAAKRDVGFVFQFYALYPHLNVRENILFPLKSVGIPKDRREAMLLGVVEQLGLSPLLRRFPSQLSGGDQQRVSLARAMIREPKIWLMDEPLGTMDADRRLEMREFIRAQQLAMGVTTLYVTHDQEEAMSLADRVVVMRDGEIRQAASPLQVYDYPADLFVAHFVGSPGMNFLQGQIADSLFRADGAAAIPVPAALPAGPCTIGVRPEYVRVLPTSAPGALSGTVATVEYFGAGWCLHVQTPLGRMVARSDRRVAAVGDPVSLSFDPSQVRHFPATS